jgi:hypothetical protein
MHPSGRRAVRSHVALPSEARRDHRLPTPCTRPMKLRHPGPHLHEIIGRQRRPSRGPSWGRRAPAGRQSALVGCGYGAVCRAARSGRVKRRGERQRADVRSSTDTKPGSRDLLEVIMLTRRTVMSAGALRVAIPTAASASAATAARKANGLYGITTTEPHDTSGAKAHAAVTSRDATASATGAPPPSPRRLCSPPRHSGRRCSSPLGVAPWVWGPRREMPANRSGTSAPSRRRRRDLRSPSQRAQAGSCE